MAITANSVYTMTNPAALFGPALFVGNSLEKFGRAYAGVTDETKLSVFSDSGTLFKEATCDFDDTGSITIAQRTLTTGKYAVNTEICIEEIEKLHAAALMSAPNTVPAVLEEFLVAYILERFGKGIENQIWAGTTGDTVVGLYTLADADGSVTEITGATISLSNVVDQFEAFYFGANVNLLSKPGLKVFMNKKDIDMYNAAIRKLGLVGGASADRTNTVSHINSELELVPTSGLASGKWFMTNADNLAYGYDFDTKGEIKVINMSDSTGDDKFRMIAKFRFGVNYAIGADVVIRK